MIWPGRWGTEAQGTHCREGEAGHNVSLVGIMGDTRRSQTISTESQGIANGGIISIMEYEATTKPSKWSLSMQREPGGSGLVAEATKAELAGESLR